MIERRPSSSIAEAYVTFYVKNPFNYKRLTDANDSVSSAAQAEAHRKLKTLRPDERFEFTERLINAVATEPDAERRSAALKLLPSVNTAPVDKRLHKLLIDEVRHINPESPHALDSFQALTDAKGIISSFFTEESARKAEKKTNQVFEDTRKKIVQDFAVNKYFTVVEDQKALGEPKKKHIPSPTYIVEARRDAVVAMIKNGMSWDDIATTLRIQPYTVANDRQALIKIGQLPSASHTSEANKVINTAIVRLTKEAKGTREVADALDLDPRVVKDRKRRLNRNGAFDNEPEEPEPEEQETPGIIHFETIGEAILSSRRPGIPSVVLDKEESNTVDVNFVTDGGVVSLFEPSKSQTNDLPTQRDSQDRDDR